jgi:hypothetical protein
MTKKLSLQDKNDNNLVTLFLTRIREPWYKVSVSLIWLDEY